MRCESLGLRGSKVDDPERVSDAWSEALGADRPCLAESVTDPAVPPIPPEANWSQMDSVVEAKLRGDPYTWSVVVKAGTKAKAQEFVPGGGDR